MLSHQPLDQLPWQCYRNPEGDYGIKKGVSNETPKGTTNRDTTLLQFESSTALSNQQIYA